MFTIQLGKTYRDEKLIETILSSEELAKARHSRVDKEIITVNNFAVTLCITRVFDTNILCVDVYSSSEDKSEKNSNIFLQFDGKEKKEWVKVKNEVVFTNTITQSDNYCTYAQQNDCWVRAAIVRIEEGTFQLKDGNFAIGEYGKYKPNLTFISSIPVIQWENVKREDFNLPKGDLSMIRGDFFTSKKGTKCFKVKANGSHILIKDSWGGAFSKYYGDTLPKEGALYYRTASSNGGGMGNDYAVYLKNWKYELSEEDI